MSEQAPDVFGFKRSQCDLFANEPARNNGVGVADPNDIRARLHKMLAEARAVESTSPWNERTTRLYQVIFPQMAHWLPDAEADRRSTGFLRHPLAWNGGTAAICVNFREKSHPQLKR